MTLRHIRELYRARHGRRADETGFSMIELLMVVAVGATLTGMTVISADSAARIFKGNAGMAQVMSQLRIARELSVNQRRNMAVEFIEPNEIRITRFELTGNGNNAKTLLNQVFLEGNVQFTLFSGVPDTPDGFGNSEAVYFAGVKKDMGFAPDGMLVYLSNPILNGPVSGTVFLGIPNQPMTARAVTVFGGTGRVRGYSWNGTAWVE